MAGAGFSRFIQDEVFPFAGFYSVLFRIEDLGYGIRVQPGGVYNKPCRHAAAISGMNCIPVFTELGPIHLETR